MKKLTVPLVVVRLVIANIAASGDGNGDASDTSIISADQFNIPVRIQRW